MHTFEILAMDSQMRREAEARCPSVNEAHFMVHEVILAALTGPTVCGRAARDGLLAQLDVKLAEGEIAHAGDLLAARTFGRID